MRAFGAETFRSLRSRNFRLFFWGQAFSQNGTWMQLVAIDLLVLHLTDDGVAVGLATAARLAPMLLLGPWAGVLADRRDHHRLLLATNAAGAIAAAAFAFTVASGAASVGWIYVLAMVAGTVTALESPARRSFVVELVDETDIANAVGLNSAMMTGSKITGPAIAGVLITTVGFTWCFAANALSYIPQLWLLTRMDRSKFRTHERVAKAKGQLREGLRYMWATPELRLPLLMIAVIGLMTFNYPVVLPLLATRDLDGGPGTYTILLSVMSVGSMIGALVVARRADIDPRYLAYSALGLAAACLGLALAPTTAVATVLVIPVGVCTMLVVSGATTMVQLHTTRAMQGRVLAMLTVVFVGTTPVGGPIVGAISEHLGARPALAIGAFAAAAAGAGVLRALHSTAKAATSTSAAPYGQAAAVVGAQPHDLGQRPEL